MTRLHAPTASERHEQILVVDDEDDLRTLVVMMLRDEGFDVAEAATLKHAEHIIDTSEVALALVDLRLTDGDGLALVRRLSTTPTTGIIIVSGKADSFDRILGLEIGADDYITKPFEHRELVARVKRHMTRMRSIREGHQTRAELEPMLLGEWTVDPSRRSVYCRGSIAPLSEAEFRTVASLLKHKGQVLSRDALYREVIGPGERDPLDRRIDVYVSSIRKKLGLNSEIRTVHRVGYIID
ncbi:response regulator transcription factor [Acuticoccus sp. M5D2P5]|uniref:response regulator transcription factor n=1 Tax=Acuticoccus kalidii TaxID=2910977 RepID=UPI001F1B9733|nr:response regulator transcription factor [Acuticoccus kalidii]MCF3932197.1 response regulator transcription factor [Acuticoccus kalidii]